MSGINRTKISLKIYKQLDRKGLLREIKVFRNAKNAFGSPDGPLFVCKIKAFYYRKDNKVITKIFPAATVNELYNDKLLVNFNEESSKIIKDDFFILDGVRYRIIDTNNTENIVYDMYLERMC